MQFFLHKLCKHLPLPPSTIQTEILLRESPQLEVVTSVVFFLNNRENVCVCVFIYVHFENLYCCTQKEIHNFKKWYT